jgi:hypothetical protein
MPPGPFLRRQKEEQLQNCENRSGRKREEGKGKEKKRGEQGEKERRNTSNISGNIFLSPISVIVEERHAHFVPHRVAHNSNLFVPMFLSSLFYQQIWVEFVETITRTNYFYSPSSCAHFSLCLNVGIQLMYFSLHYSDPVFDIA